MSLFALLNPAKACLSMSAVLAGYCLLRFFAYTSGNQLVLPYLLAAGALLSMAESAWRLLFAVAARNDTDSPPSGGLSTTAAFFVTSFITLAGLMCAMTGGVNSFRAAGCLVFVLLVRSALFRTTEVVSPLLGGAAAGMLCVVGMTAHPAFMEMLGVGETRTPALFFALYVVVVRILSQARDSAKPRETPAGDELSGQTASRLLEVRDGTVDRAVVWLGGGALVLMPLALALIMPWRWLSWTLLGFLSFSTLMRLIPVLAYKTRKDLGNLIGSLYRGSVLLNAGAVASLGDYRLREIYGGWALPVPGREEMAAMAVIVCLAFPAWVLRNAAPVE